MKQYEAMFQCPICFTSMKIVDLKSIVCTKNHTFDLARQGHANLLIKQIKTNYDKRLFQARRKVIKESGCYDSLHKEIVHLIEKHIPNKKGLTLIDMGTGEGTHLAQIKKSLLSKDRKVSGVGIDISKDGILEAAKAYNDLNWFVADIANTPFKEATFFSLLNILSPSNYGEFNRLIKDDGIIIKVIPGNEYFIQLRNFFHKQTEEQNYSNQKVLNHFKDHFSLINKVSIHETRSVDPSYMESFVHMSPLTWQASEKEIQRFLKTNEANITIDLEILVGSKK